MPNAPDRPIKGTVKGNQTTVKNHTDMVPKFVTYSVTNYNGKKAEDGTPIIDDEDVALSKKFVDENHK